MRSFDQSLGSIASASESAEISKISVINILDNHYPAHRRAAEYRCVYARVCVCTCVCLHVCVHVCAGESRELFLIMRWVLSTARNARLPPTCTRDDVKAESALTIRVSRSAVFIFFFFFS